MTHRRVRPVDRQVPPDVQVAMTGYLGVARSCDVALGLRLDEEDKGVEEYPVACRGGSAILGLQPLREKAAIRAS